MSSNELERMQKIKDEKKWKALEMMRQGLLIPQISNDLGVAPFYLRAWQTKARRAGLLREPEEIKIDDAPKKVGLGFCTVCGNRTGGGQYGVVRPGLCPNCERRAQYVSPSEFTHKEERH